jgi:hypothetical protein
MAKESALVWRLKRWLSTTWKMSPAAMYSLAWRTMSSYRSWGMLAASCYRPFFTPYRRCGTAGNGRNNFSLTRAMR